MIDTCSGCGKHPGVCMCRTTVPVDLDEVRNRKKKTLADALRETAQSARRQQLDTAAMNLVALVKREAAHGAAKGNMGLVVWLESHNYTKAEAEEAARHLEKEGFVCQVDIEVTAYHSNTDWDQEDVLKVSWE